MHVWPIKTENIFLNSKTYKGYTLAININESCWVHFSIELWDNQKKKIKIIYFSFWACILQDQLLLLQLLCKDDLPQFALTLFCVLCMCPNWELVGQQKEINLRLKCAQGNPGSSLRGDCSSAWLYLGVVIMCKCHRATFQPSSLRKWNAPNHSHSSQAPLLLSDSQVRRPTSNF